MRVSAQPFRFGWLAWLCLFVQEPRRAIAAFLAAYAAATCFSPNVLAFDAFSERADSFLVPIAAIIRWLGSMTFALYLFHQLQLSLFTVYHVSDRSSSAQLVLLVGGTFPVVPLGRSCENTKGAYKRFLLTAWRFVASRAAMLDGVRQFQLNLERSTQAVGERMKHVIAKRTLDTRKSRERGAGQAAGGAQGGILVGNSSMFSRRGAC